MDRAIVFDCEFLTAEGAMSRFWCGPFDPDPTVVQIGAVALGLADDFPILARENILVTPKARDGSPVRLDPFFTELTGVDEDTIAREGVPLAEALARFAAFGAGATLWSWGKDEFYLVAISCFVEGIAPPIEIGRFGNASALMLRAGMPYADIQRTRSNALSAYFGIDHPPLRAHDAVDDALSVAYTLQHLLRRGALSPSDLTRPVR